MKINNSTQANIKFVKDNYDAYCIFIRKKLFEIFGKDIIKKIEIDKIIFSNDKNDCIYITVFIYNTSILFKLINKDKYVELTNNKELHLLTELLNELNITSLKQFNKQYDNYNLEFDINEFYSFVKIYNRNKKLNIIFN